MNNSKGPAKEEIKLLRGEGDKIKLVDFGFEGKKFQEFRKERDGVVGTKGDSEIVKHKAYLPTFESCTVSCVI